MKPETIFNGFEETLTFEYKASLALDRQGKAADEMCKDISSMANSAGGQIIYGIEEDKLTHKPLKIDVGVTDPKVTREWIEQIILSRVHPRIQKLSITRISLDSKNARFAFVLATEPTTIGAHQAPDKRYYKRFELSAVPMDDYEIRDVSRRASSPVLDVALAFRDGSPTQPPLRIRHELCDPIYVQFTVSNLSNKPAEYAILNVYVDCSFAIGDPVNFGHPVQYVERFGTACQLISANLSLPGAPPLFREYPEIAGSMSIALLANKVGTLRLVLGCDICTPGFIRRKLWIARALGSVLMLEAGVDEPI